MDCVFWCGRAGRPVDWTGCALCAEWVWKCRQPTLLRGLRRRQGTLRDVGTGGGERVWCALGRRSLSYVGWFAIVLSGVRNCGYFRPHNTGPRNLPTLSNSNAHETGSKVIQFIHPNALRIGDKKVYQAPSDCCDWAGTPYPNPTLIFSSRPP